MMSNPSDNKFCLDKPCTLPIGASHLVLVVFSLCWAYLVRKQSASFEMVQKTNQQLFGSYEFLCSLDIFWSKSSRFHWFIINYKIVINCRKCWILNQPKRFSRFLHWKHREGLLPLGVAWWQHQQSAGGQRHRVPCHLQSLRTGAVALGLGRSWAVNPNSQNNLGGIKNNIFVRIHPN